MNFRERLRQEKAILFDGAMGTQIHEFQPSEKEYQGKLGCSEILNLTVPEKIQEIHERYLASGADVIETNTFGANRIVLTEYELQDKVRELNLAALKLARQAVEKFSTSKPRFIAASMGPGTKIASLGHTTYDVLYDSYYEQSLALIEGGADLFMIETCQDPLQIKAAVNAVRDAQSIHKTNIPIAVSVTVETTGTLLVGTEISAVIAILSSMGVDILGMNCATGPDKMRPYVKQLCKQFEGPVLVMPNAGLPQNIGGKMSYSLTKEDFVKTVVDFVQEDGVQIVGGCCGTNPSFIQMLHDRLQNVTIAKRNPCLMPSVASLFSAQTIAQSPAPMFIGERANTNGSKQFKDCLLGNDWDGIVAIARSQEKTGAHTMDLCVAYTGRDEKADMVESITRIAKQIHLPLVIDSTEIPVLEAALKLYGGRPIINSINLESGEGKADKICSLAKRYGAALIALTIDEQGMALNADRKIQIAKRIYDIAVNRHGLKPGDLIFDFLTFTLGSGDDSLKTSARETLSAIQRSKTELPGVYTTLGVSNVSFGLSPSSREILNSVFLAQAVKSGLDTAIVNVKKILPLHAIEEEDRLVAENLIHYQGEDPLGNFIRHFQKKEGQEKKVETRHETLSLEEKIRMHIIQGNRSGLEPLLMQQLQSKKALEIINEILIPSMKVVGDLFATGEMQLPFVLQSAEVMKFSVDKLKPYLEKSDEESQTSIVLATVRGDVHDIGKNLVDIILSNNGYKVYNLGIKCEIDTMLAKALEVKADAIGMSGLLVKSTVVMKENLEEMKKRSLAIPILLGGAALTKGYVMDVCAPISDGPVLYCADAFDGLKVMKAIKEKNIEELVAATKERHKKQAVSHTELAQEAKIEIVEEISRTVSIPKPPFWGSKVIADIDLEEVYPYLTEEVLFRGRWGYRRRNLSKEAYQEMIDKEVRPQLEKLKKQAKEEGQFVPKVIYGYYPCQSEDQDVILYHPDSKQELARFTFPRQKKAPYRCIADFFCTKKSNTMDIIALQVVTIGEKAQEISAQMFAQDRYKEYLLFHGLSVETAEALAEYWHKKIRTELHILEEEGNGIEDFVVQKYRGSRYSFGYPSCPDMEGNSTLLQVLGAERIQVQATAEGQMVPEQTTSAFIVHHPQAKYFNLS
ncbi:MAG: methionine synthase [Candidatus Brocadiae bacterium]|nr:methionine synthase [Candidatus Brocadiia bacterium]